MLKFTTLKFTTLIACALCVSILLAVPLYATDYFVCTEGNDGHDGRSPRWAFATIQKGVDSLQPGDTLTIAPGEYFGSVRRTGLGGADVDTIIQAEIPGTVLMRGDVALPPLRKVEGTRFTYVTDYDGDAHTVNELDTLRILEATPDLHELDFAPGTFFHDRPAGQLYLSPPDMQPATARRYTVSATGTHGLYLRDAQRVIVQGLAATGFNGSNFVPHREGTGGGVWGMYLMNASRCTIRDSYACFNGRGIGSNSSSDNSGDNTIERCVAWANSSRYGGPFGGLTLHQPRRDFIRDSISFLNGHKGVNIRVSDDAVQRGEPARSKLVNNLAWGNPIDIRIKGAASGHIAERNVAMRAIEWFRSDFNTLAGGFGAGHDRLRSEDTLLLSAERQLDVRQEFADPDNFDYRLQATSRFRGRGPSGTDQGAFPYQQNIYYVAPTGDDAADGLALATAWRSLGHAAQQLQPGDTLYLIEGTYHEALPMPPRSDQSDRPIHLRGRGLGEVVIQGAVSVQQTRHVQFERLNFTSPVTVRDSSHIHFHNCRFFGEANSLTATNTDHLRVTHGEFTRFTEAAIDLQESNHVFLSGNLFDNAHGPGVRSDSPDAILYSDYNSYGSADHVWQVAERSWALQDLQRLRPKLTDRHSQQLTPQYSSAANQPILQNPGSFATGGPMGRPLGVYLPHVRYAGNQVHVDGPMVHSVTATTANLEWWSSRPAIFRVRWGTTASMENTVTLSRVSAYHPANPIENFNTFSLTGLTPGTPYFFRIELLGVIDDTEDGIREDLTATVVGLDDKPLVFTTTAQDASPRTLYVAADGDNRRTGLTRQQAWRTINHAADQARPGDTILIGEGVYYEHIRLRTTGEQDAAITFRSHPGEKVVMDGNHKQLQNAFTIFNKQHIHIDGLYVKDHARGRMRTGTFGLLRAHHIRLTRIFHDGRGQGTDSALLTAAAVSDLLVRNCVSLSGWNNLEVGRSTNVVIEHSVFVRSDIVSLATGGGHERRDVVVRSNIVTDNLARKAGSHLVGHVLLENNAFFLRVPEHDRSVFGSGRGTLAQYDREHPIKKPNMATNPQFAALDGKEMFPADGFFDDRMLREFNDFTDLFATNPTLVQRQIGLIPADFDDMATQR
ncbi:MAG: hypothetical protein EA424_05550 [Planctomycetaceae bacterium]|nr:MAG: hypothetical protein EA424_05550 [Planctomycetaceae bacterium]